MSITLNASTSSGFVQSADNSGEIELQSNGTTALKVNTNEGIQILNCLGVGNATPSTSGAGITFPATQSASSDANTLDDYEEGTFTPFVRGASTQGTASYNRQIGIYTKIGNRVFFTISIEWLSGTGTGALGLGGLPFTQNGNSYDIPYAVSECGDIAWDANYMPTPIGIHNTTVIFLNASRVGASGSSINTSYDAAGSFSMTGHYRIT